MKTNFNTLKVGDIIRITINDCGSGTAVVLSKDETSMTIRMDAETFTTCYDCQSMGSPFMEVREDEIYQIEKVEEDITMSKNVKEVKNVNVHAEGYITKDAIRKELESFGVKLSSKQFRNTKREELLKMFEKAKVQQPTITEVIPAQPVQSDKRREKYNLFCHLVKTNALENKKKGYGHVVSAYMLCAHILKADYGLEKLKGHENEVTPEQRAKVKEVRNFMIDKGHIKAVTWSYNNVTYYSSEYDGKNKNFMVPVEKAPKDAKLAVTTYKVMW